jgi:hypothetical protein
MDITIHFLKTAKTFHNVEEKTLKKKNSNDDFILDFNNFSKKLVRNVKFKPKEFF